MIASVTHGLAWNVWPEDRGLWGGHVTDFGGETVCETHAAKSRAEVQGRLRAFMERYGERQAAA